jgi:hypothetical protein
MTGSKCWENQITRILENSILIMWMPSDASGLHHGFIKGFKANSVVPTHLSSDDMRRQYWAMTGWNFKVTIFWTTGEEKLVL